MNYPEVLEKLCAVSAPSGFEGSAARAAAELLRPLVQTVHTDRMGSVTGFRPCGKEGAPAVLLDAHLDEVGFVITSQQGGFLTFDVLGGVDRRLLPGREITVLCDPPVQGVVVCQPPDEKERTPDIGELMLDTGLSREELRRRVPAGTPAVFRGGCTRLGKNRLTGKALDDRSCFAVLLGALELLKDADLDVDLIVLGSVQEETFSTGAITTAFRMNPSMCVCVDVTFGDSPDTSRDPVFRLGGGPVIGLGPNCTRWMSRRMQRKAEELGMKVQLEVMPGASGTNGWEMQVVREGIATAILSVPLRYMHTPVEVVQISDLEEAAQLLAAFLQGLGEEAASRD